ncbi:hypothetical protein AALO_G00015310 [Alosa alosa]|uniref:Transmembrane protein 109-like n=1 Tax=Alosa alosa TaxID=278164 RepID=A0AAV6HLU0_9TELE|nr:transmembrane protein 109 [Alosa alosa]KAG5286481.1 hypothetical protein AALO_G00015310 [Alosa alosa]
MIKQEVIQSGLRMARISCGWILLYLVLVASISFCSSSSAQEDGKKTETQGVLRTFREVLSDLSVDARGYLVSFVGERAVDTSLQSIRSAVKSLSEGTASCLNIVFQYITELLSATGTKVQLPFNKVTPDGVLLVSQWALLAVIGYWMVSLLLRLVAGLVRRVLWLLKLGGALVLFGLILSDTDASMETTALRLGGLVIACVLLGVGPRSGAQDHTSHLEEQVRRLEKRLREMESRRKKE